MGQESNARLAVARLEELTPAHRYREGQPMHGFCLISGDGKRCRVTLYVENGRALTDRSGRGGFYYEGWLVGPEGPVSLGAFNLGPGGQGSATRVFDGSTLQAARSDLIRVTAEPFGGSQAGSIAVLEGRPVWMETGAGAEPEPAEAPDALAGVAGEESEYAAPEELARVRETAWVEEPVLQPVVARAAEGQAQAEAEPVPEPVAEPAEPVAEPTPPAPAAAAPVTPAPPAPRAEEPRNANPLEMHVQLVQRHPMAPRAAGAATVSIRQGALTLMLRGLPSPTALGRDRATDRPFNGYRVWLVNQQTQSRTPVGFCQRAWGENFRFQGEGLPLNRHDTILVTVEDRTASGANNASPQVLIGSYMA